jgi:hypothetical protein
MIQWSRMVEAMIDTMVSNDQLELNGPNPDWYSGVEWSSGRMVNPTMASSCGMVHTPVKL